jgi:serine/threonine protein kinase
MARVLVAAVARMHDVGVAHLDLKPANVLLRDAQELSVGRELFLIDFDFAIHRNQPPPWPMEWGFVGTIGFQSPEHFRGGEPPGPHSDVFTLGVILYELLGQQRPWADTSSEHEYRQRILNDRRPIFAPRPSIESLVHLPALRYVLSHALSPRARDRPTVGQLHSVLLEKFDDRGAESALSASVGEHARRESSHASGSAAAPQRIPVPSTDAVRFRSQCGNRVSLCLPLVFGRFRLQSAGIVGASVVSREQFRIARAPQGVWTIELCFGANTNAQLNGIRMVASTSYVVHYGDEILVADAAGTGVCMLTAEAS